MAKVADTPENEDLCICPDCPSFPGESNVFCARGKSPKPVRRRGCLCPDCRVFKDNRLEDGYYCADGAAGEGPK
jgi:methylamine---glutamate N-methyltransferase subunit C